MAEIQKRREKKITKPTCLIITLVPYPYGGGEGFMYQTIKWLQEELNFRCIWVAFGQDKITIAQLHVEDGCLFHTQPGYPTEHCLDVIYRTYRPDIIHLQGPIIYVALPCFKKYRVPLIIGFHFWTGIFMPNQEGLFENKDILNHVSRLSLDPRCQEINPRMSFYVASDFMNQVINKLGGHEIKNVIYPIPPDEHYKVNTRKKKKYITMININEGKGGDLLLEIIRALPNLPFLVISNEPNTGKYRWLDDAIEKEINGKFLRSYTDIKEIYAKTRILLIPSHVDETFSRVAYEGAANGIPIITTGKGFIRQLLGQAGIYLSDNDPNEWIDVIRKIYHQEDLLDDYGHRLQEQVKTLENPKMKFISLVENLLPLSPKKNVMIYAPWCDQGLGLQAKLYSQLLRRQGFYVHIFSFLPYLCIDQQGNFHHDPHEWFEYDSLYQSYNTREEVTPRELRQFVMAHNIGICLIPEICYSPIYEKVKILKDLNVSCYAIPNIETCRKDELGHYSLFEKILCPTKQCYDILKEKGLSHLVYLGHCLPITPRKKEILHLKERITFLHVSGYNALTRKRTLEVIRAFKEAREIIGDDKITLTVTFSNGIPPDIRKYQGAAGLNLIAKPLSHREILDLYSNHDISIQVSSHEGLGLGFYESLACQTPVISLDQAPHNEVIIDGRSGWLLESKKIELKDNDQAMVYGGEFDEQSLVHLLLKLAFHPEEVKSMIEKCRQEQKKWSQEIFLERLITYLV